MGSDLLKIEERPSRVVVLTLDRQHAKNALNEAMIGALHSALDRLASERCKGLVLTGAGTTFASGADIAELLARKREDAFRRINSGLFAKVEAFAAPTVAAINGYALGGGMELALACDIRVASETAKLGQPEVGLGIIPGAGATYRLPRIVGLGRAKDLILTGRIVDANEAFDMGLVNHVATDALSRAIEIAEQAARNSALALSLAKEALNTHAFGSLDSAMAFESTAQAVLFEDEEKRARMQAFLDKRRGHG